MAVQIVLTPTNTWVQDAVNECESSFIVASPFVGQIFADMLATLPNGVKSVLVTRVNLKDFALGLSDISAVASLAERGTVVKSLPGLHAKVYVVDSKRALVTSGNATTGGFQRNWECGIAVDDAATVNRLAELVLSGFGASENPVSWEAEELISLKEPANLIRKSLPDIPVEYITQLEKLTVEIPDKSSKDLVSSLGGWTSLTMEGVLRQERDVFSLNELFAVCEHPASVRYPNNKHVRAKLRQQLQRLRDLGLIEFLGGGVYRRLVYVGGEK